jgi:hypothetical protein
MAQPEQQLREDIRVIANNWVHDHGGSITTLVDAFYDYVLTKYGPPF